MAGDADIVGFIGGFGTGKSVLGARWLIAQAVTHPTSHFLAMGQSFAEAQETTFRKLFKQLPGENTGDDPGRSPIVAEYTQSKRLLALTNGAVIVLGSADSKSRYAGAEFGAIWLDEPSHYETDLHDLLETLGSRLRGVAGPKCQCWTLTGNGYNDAWEILERRQDATGEPLGLTIDLIRASTLENPYLDAEDHDRFKRQFGGTERAAQALHGEFNAAQGLVYATFTRDAHVIPHTEAVDRVSDDWRVYGYDAGWNDPRVVLELGKTSYDQLVVLDAFYESDSHVEDAIAWLETHDKPRGTIYCEHEPADIDRFTKADYPATSAMKAIDPGVAEVRRRLERDGNRAVDGTGAHRTSVVRRGTPEALHQHRQHDRDKTTRGDTRDEPPVEPASDRPYDGAVGLLVSERCESLIREFFSYKEVHVGTTAAQDDCLDALRYAVMGVAGGETGGRTHTVHR